jgi:hypothetical protein
MYSIDVDFEVYKQLTVRRATERVTYNDVIRELLGLKKAPVQAAGLNGASGGDWTIKGVRFPSGTVLRAEYKGKDYAATVEGGALVLDGKRFSSPSAAAVSITKAPVNGWVFWKCRFPGQSDWILIKSLRVK